MKKEEGLSLVIAYLEDSDTEIPEFWLTPRKISDRAYLIDDPDRPDWIVFELERHRATLGTAYSKGMSMAAFITYWPRYAFNPKAKILEELGDFRPSEVDIDTHSVVEAWLDDISFEFSPTEDERHKCRELCAGKEVEVSSIEEVERYAITQAKEWNLEIIETELSEYLTPEKVSEFLDEFRKVLKEEVVCLAKRDWEEYQKELAEDAEEVT